MKKADFFAALHTAAPGSSPEAAKAWIEFALECVQSGQYAGFIPPSDQEAGVEKWLDALCGGVYAVRAEYGAEVAGKLVGLSLDNCCLYPGEMLQAAACLRDGGTAETILQKIRDDGIESEQPFFMTPVQPLTERDCGPDIQIQEREVPCGMGGRRMEPGYVLRDGTVLLESEREASGCYMSGAGMAGMYLRTPEVYRPVYTDDGQLWAFRQVRPAPENYLATVPMQQEGNKMTHDEFQYLTELPGTPLERSWVRERLETLSEWEGIVLAAVTARQPPETTVDAANRLLSLDDCAVRLAAGGYEDLGQLQLRAMASDQAEELLEYVDLYGLGTKFEDAHPGLFVGDYYVEYPPDGSSPVYSDHLNFQPDSGWSVKLKLASPSVPEGVWLRLPDGPEMGSPNGEIGEATAVMKALRVLDLDDCTLLEARCVLPELGDLTEQYSSVAELVQDGDNLGYIMDELGKDDPNWMEKFAAALEYENCRTLKFALDISQNLRCYEWYSRGMLKDFAAEHLRTCGVSDELLQSGCVDLQRYAEDLLETSGYMLTVNEDAYVMRNRQEFVREFTSDEPDSPSKTPSMEM